MKNVITMSKFGRMGRFGNQVFQLMFLAKYAKDHALELQLPPWVGNQIFQTQFHPLTTRRLPVVAELDETPDLRTARFPSNQADGIVHRNFDYHGYAQYPTSYFAPSRDYLTSLFALKPVVTERLAEPVAKLQAMGDLVIGIHLRRGDYGRGMFYITPVTWYLKVLDEIWKNQSRPVLFISTETPELVKEFDRFNPQTTDMLGVDLQAKPLLNYNYLKHDLRIQDPRQLDWVPDWVLLRHSHILLIPNSTFSFSAAMFPLTGRGDCYKSKLTDGGGFELFDPWNAQPLSYTAIDKYPELCAQGCRLDSNAYWKD